MLKNQWLPWLPSGR